MFSPSCKSVSITFPFSSQKGVLWFSDVREGQGRVCELLPNMNY